MSQDIEILSETDDFSIWSVQDPDGEATFHLELGNTTVHFLREDWEQFLDLVRPLSQD